MVQNYFLQTNHWTKKLLLSFIFLIITNSYCQQTFTVNTTEDLPDINIQDGICNDLNGNCSLRAAIENANLTVETDNIHFNIPPEDLDTIVLKDDLPIINETLILDAKTQPGYSFYDSRIILDGRFLEDKYNSEDEREPRIVFYLSGNSSGTEISGFTIGGIVSSYSVAIYAKETGKHWFHSNKIGCTSDGLKKYGNNSYGMYFEKSDNNLIGGEDASFRNVISGNGNAIGMEYSNYNRFEYNYIGTGINGKNYINGGDGILMWLPSLEDMNSRDFCSYNIIKNNIIVGGFRGIMVRGDYNLIEENIIGADITGTKALPNTMGILLSGGKFNKIGGEKGNLISGNDTGITVYDSENIISNNLIGTDLSGSSALANKAGIIVHTKVPEYDAANNLIVNNVISGNSEVGIYLNYSDGNQLYQNIIGLNKTGDSPIPNGNGINIFDSSNSEIQENVISGSLNNGINIIGDREFAINNRFSKNSISQNGSVGIDLGANGITKNDSRDWDSGVNNYQNYPEIINASYDTNLQLEYKIDSDPAYSAYPVTIEVFLSDGNRQGKEYLGEYLINANDLPKGKRTLKAELDIVTGVKQGDKITATATDANGNTSEFSADIQVIVIGGCTTETYYADTDNDGFGDAANTIESCTQESGYVLDNTDCDDSDPLVYPGALDDTIDGVDQNCDGIDGPVTNCQGADTLLLTEECSTDTNVYWNISNPGTCDVNGSWELRKNSSTGESSGTFSIAGGESVQVVSGSVNKGKTQIIVYWSDSNGNELSTNQNASGIECTSGMSMLSQEASLVVSPNPVTEGIGMYFITPLSDTSLNATIYNSGGQMMASQSFAIAGGTSNFLWEIDHSTWIEGVYILNVDIAGQNYQTQFIK